MNDTLHVKGRAEADALRLDALSVSYRMRGRDVTVIDEVSLRIAPGEAYGLVGESGCGKSTVALALAAYLPRGARLTHGTIEVLGAPLAGSPPERLQRLWRDDLAMVFQDPTRALNPSLRIERQLDEVFALRDVPARERGALAREALEQMRIAQPARVLASYAHELSGGMQQRVVIAMALAKQPRVLILDEPTTGLDATVEADVLARIDALRREQGVAVLLISHDLRLVARLCDRVGVLYAGCLIEEGCADDVLGTPRHPYTASLLDCLPSRTSGAQRLRTLPGQLPAPGARPAGCVFSDRCALASTICVEQAPPAYPVSDPTRQHISCCHHHTRVAESTRPAASPEAAGATAKPVGAQQGHPVLSAHRLSKTFHVDGVAHKAVDEVSLHLNAGETLGLVGESGSGKTTLARLLMGLTAPDPGGTLEMAGQALAPQATRRAAEQSRDLQIVFQNPASALNRAHTVRRVLGRAVFKLGGLRRRAQRIARLEALSDAVRLPRRHLDARSRQLSGGQQQRVAIARAFAGNPRVVVCDEPTSALDVSVQAAILNLLDDLQRERGVSYLFISHDLPVVRYVSDRVGVLYRGRLVEIGPTETVFAGRGHPYTARLLAAAAGEAASSGAAPDTDAHAGCAFRDDCPCRDSACDLQAPPLQDCGGGHWVACHVRRDTSAPR